MQKLNEINTKDKYFFFKPIIPILILWLENDYCNNSKRS